MEEWEKEYESDIVGSEGEERISSDANPVWYDFHKKRIEDAQPEWYDPIVDLGSRIGFESAGAAAGYRGGQRLTQGLPPGANVARMVVPPIAGAIGGLTGKRTSQALGTELPGDENVLSDIYAASGGIIGTAPASVAGTCVRKVLGASPETQQAIREATERGIRYTPGTVSDSKLVRALEQRLKEFPLTAPNVDRALEEMFSDFQQAVKHLTSDETLDLTTDAWEVGKRIQASAAAKVGKYEERAEALFNIVASHGLSPQHPVVLSKTKDFLAKYAGEYGDEYKELAEVFGDSFLEILKKKIDDVDELPWGIIDQVRKQVGIRTKGARTETFNPKLAKKLYSILLDDMGVAASEISPEINNAWRNARRYWNMMGKSVDETFKDLLKAEPEKLFNALERGTFSQIARARKASDPDTWKMVQAAVAQRMGRTTAGQQDFTGQVFSPRTFLTNFNKLRMNSEKPIRHLFQKAGKYEGIYDDLSVLARIADRMTKPSGYANPSGTSNALAIMGVFGGVLYDPLRVGVAVAGTLGSGKLWTNPRFLQWLHQGKNISPNSRALVNWVTSMPVFYGTEHLSARDDEALAYLKGKLMDWAEIPSVPFAQVKTPNRWDKRRDAP